MHSSHPSRGRLLFEVFCALAVSASLVGAWMQTGASALLAAASVATLFGLVHAFGLFRRNPAIAVAPQRIEFERDDQVDLPTSRDFTAPLEAAEQQPTTRSTVEEADPVEPAAPRASRDRRTKAPRKGGGRRGNAPKEAKVTGLAPLEEAEVAVPMPAEEAGLVMPEPSEEVAHIALAPLFEPEPYVRQQKAVFGRKAG